MSYEENYEDIIDNEVNNVDCLTHEVRSKVHDCKDNRIIELLCNNRYSVVFPEKFEEFHVNSNCVYSVEILSKKQVRIDILVCADKDVKCIPNLQDICCVEMNLLNKTFPNLLVRFNDSCGCPLMTEEYFNAKLVSVQRSSILTCNSDKALTFGLTFQYENLEYYC